MAVIRGNASEITCLAAHKSGQDFGVDSRLGPADPALASSLASHLGTTVAITGASMSFPMAARRPKSATAVPC